MLGLYKLIFVKKSMRDKVRILDYTSKKTGLRGWARTKGAILSTLQIYDQIFNFLLVHLAADKGTTM